jgi:ABC-type polysaccharide/polyol phosphate export permease
MTTTTTPATEAAPAPAPAAEPTEVFLPTVTGLPPLRAYMHSLWQRRQFIWELARTQLKAENYGTFFGQAWLILDPLILALVYLLVRSVVRPIGDGDDRGFLISHLISSVFFFQYTVRGLMKGAKSLEGNKQMILNTAFPRATFPIAAMIRNFLDFMPGLAVIFIIHFWLGQPFGLTLLYLPLLLLLLTMFSFGCMLIFAPLTVFFRDTTGFLPYITKVWLFTTPVLYTASEIPPGRIGDFLIWNPLYPYFACLEQVLQNQPISLTYIAASAGWSIGVLLVGAVMFLVRERDFAVRL